MANQINSLVGTGAEFYADSIVVTDGEALGDLTGGCDPDRLNQIGTLTQKHDVAQTARERGWVAVVSHRGGENRKTAPLADCVASGAARGQRLGPNCRRTDGHAAPGMIPEA